MIQKSLSHGTFYQGLDTIRIITGGIIMYYGLEITDPKQIAGYVEWLNDVGMPFPKIMVYLGKISELTFGLFLSIGFLTRLSTIPLMITMSVITFIMLGGKITNESFYLLLLFACFFFTGSGKISVDHLIKKHNLN